MVLLGRGCTAGHNPCSIPTCHMQRNKKTILVKQMRREIADLLRKGQQEYARIRVEGVIRENLLMQV